MTVTVDDIVSILTLAQNSSCEELHIEMGEFKLTFRQPRRGGGPTVVDAPPVVAASASAKADAKATQIVAPTVPEGGAAITAPMVGTFYRAPAPGEPPFVEVGSVVEADTTVCIIEVMKVMNPIKAGRGGRIAHIAVGDGDAVEFAQVLIVIEPT